MAKDLLKEIEVLELEQKKLLKRINDLEYYKKSLVYNTINKGRK